MASPPHSYSPSGSPPSYHQNLSFPMSSKKRSAEFAGSQPPSLKRRKASTLSVSSIPSPHPGHPLRQASFPPPEEYAAAYSRSPSVDSAAPSMISAAGPPKKKRGRKPKSAASGVEPPTRAQTPSVAGPDGGAQAQLAADDPQNDADDDDFDPELNAGVDMTTAQETDENKETETRLRSLLIGNLDKEQAIRYEKWKTFRVPDAAVRRVVNATVSQSVPANVVLAVRSVVKVFIGELVEASRRVQEEWIASTGEKQTETGDQPPPLPGCNPNPTGRKGPLRPDHVREAYRRYKMSNEGGGAGVMGAWHYQNHSGVERFATKAGGKRLFR